MKFSRTRVHYEYGQLMDQPSRTEETMVEYDDLTTRLRSIKCETIEGLYGRLIHAKGSAAVERLLTQAIIEAQAQIEGFCNGIGPKRYYVSDNDSCLLGIKTTDRKESIQAFITAMVEGYELRDYSQSTFYNKAWKVIHAGTFDSHADRLYALAVFVAFPSLPYTRMASAPSQGLFDRILGSRKYKGRAKALHRLSRRKFLPLPEYATACLKFIESDPDPVVRAALLAHLLRQHDPDRFI